MIQNHPYTTAFVTFFIALALGLYLQLQPQIVSESDHLSDNNDGASSNGRNNRWYRVRPHHDASEKHPSPRLAHASATVKHNNNNTEMMYVFGGLYGGTSKDTSPPRILSDMWRYDAFYHSWHAVQQQGSGSRAPSGRIHSTLSATEDGKQLVLFGGFDGFVSDPNHKAIDDGVWIFDIAKGSWRNYNIKDETRPSARGSHETVIIGDNLFLFGGTAKIGTSFANSAEFWSFSLKTYKWKLLASSSSASSLSAFPRGRQGFPMVKIGGDDDTHQIYLFGGNCEPPTIQHHKKNDNSHHHHNNNKPVDVDVRAENDKPLPPLLPTECNDEWIIDVSSAINDADHQPTFTQLQTTGDIPSPRRATHVAAAVTTTMYVAPDATHHHHHHHHVEGQLFLFGGLSIALKKKQQQEGTPTAPIPVPTLFDDFYMLDLKNKIWKKISHNSEMRPPPLFGHTCVQVRDKIVLFGGRASTMASPGTNDVWEYRLMN